MIPPLPQQVTPGCIFWRNYQKDTRHRKGMQYGGLKKSLYNRDICSLLYINLLQNCSSLTYKISQKPSLIPSHPSLKEIHFLVPEMLKKRERFIQEKGEKDFQITDIWESSKKKTQATLFHLTENPTSQITKLPSTFCCLLSHMHVCVRDNQDQPKNKKIKRHMKLKGKKIKKNRDSNKEVQNLNLSFIRRVTRKEKNQNNKK